MSHERELLRALTFLAFTAMDVRERYNGTEKEIGRRRERERKVRSVGGQEEERKADRADAF